jgi:aminoglycoside phosphotransferase (APT) family kinase protein
VIEGLSMGFDPTAVEWLARAIGGGAQDIRVVPMKGSTSSSLFRVQTAPGVDTPRYVLRVLDNREWLAEEPDLAAHEAAALGEARAAGLPAPEPVAFSAEEVGFGAPVVLMTFLEGAVELRPADREAWLQALAGELAAIHRHPASGFAWQYASWVDMTNLAPPTWTARPRAWERAIAVVGRGRPQADPVFIHRDYHPTNVLWRDGAISGVVDWVNACRGPAAVDLAHCRTNLAVMYGIAVADRFLEHYREAAAGFVYDAYWDLHSLLEWCFPELEFYRPWQDFGLAVIPQETLRQRVEAYLQSVLSRFERLPARE